MYKIYKSKNEKPRFGQVFNLEKEICSLGITNPRDIALLYNQYRGCIEQEKEETPSVEWYENRDFHEGVSITALKHMKERYKWHMEGVFMMPFVPRCAGTVIGTSNGIFRSAINGKIYMNDDYINVINDYNRKRGFLLSDLDYDVDLCADDIEKVCNGLKTYKTEEVFPKAFFDKVKIEPKDFATFKVEDSEDA